MTVDSCFGSFDRELKPLSNITRNQSSTERQLQKKNGTEAAGQKRKALMFCRDALTAWIEHNSTNNIDEATDNLRELCEVIEQGDTVMSCTVLGQRNDVSDLSVM